MFKIFFRIYLYILATIICGILFAYFLLLPALQSVDKEEDIRLLQGTVQLLINEFADLGQKHWQEKTEKLTLDYSNLVTIKTLDSIDIKTNELKDLMNGHLVSIYEEDIFYQRIQDSNFALSLHPPIHETPWFLAKDTRVTDLTVSLLLKSLKPNDQSFRPTDLQEMNKLFGFPIQVRQVDTINLPEEARKRLRKAQRVLDQKAEVIYHPIEDSENVLVLGPISLNEPWLLKLAVYLFLGTLLISCAFASLFWARPLWKDMDTLSSAALTLGSGDFSSRVRLGKKSYLREVAEVFNSMATRLQVQVGGQKELINTISHELRTPIMRIRLISELLYNSTAETTETNKLFNELRDNMDELDELTNEFLEYLKFEQIPQKFRRERTPIKPWLKRTLDPFQMSQKTHHLQFILNLDTDSQTIHLDKRMMSRALSNLIQNAVHYAREEVHISLTIKNDSFILIIDDDGPGIPEEERERIFHPFIRLQSIDEGRQTKGYGLGLSIVRRIVEWHDGTIVAETSPLGGARLKICWSEFSTETI